MAAKSFSPSTPSDRSGFVRLSWILKGTGWRYTPTSQLTPRRGCIMNILCKLPTTVSVLSISGVLLCGTYAALQNPIHGSSWAEKANAPGEFIG